MTADNQSATTVSLTRSLDARLLLRRKRTSDQQTQNLLGNVRRHSLLRSRGPNSKDHFTLTSIITRRMTSCPFGSFHASRQPLPFCHKRD
jgi:hypothetical protein